MDEIIGYLKKEARKQDLLIQLYEELLSNTPRSKKELTLLKLRLSVAREEILKSTHNIKKGLDQT
ncbi:hypothetical protein GOV05_00870 [Candidatus Woesearchaeota archaeon]|nr:hypothetical protein [Candidatus Woesearchaeota archaeon]